MTIKGDENSSRPWYGLPENEERRAYLLGLEQFNAGDFYAAHDTWEEIWQRLDGERALFYQTLIRTAVIFVHMQNVNAAGVRAVYASLCERNFPHLPTEYLGVNLGELRQNLTRAVTWIIAGPPGAWRERAKRTAAGEAMLFDVASVFRIHVRTNADPADR